MGPQRKYMGPAKRPVGDSCELRKAKKKRIFENASPSSYKMPEIEFFNGVSTELMVKFGECCGNSVSLKCKLPNEDLDVLVSIKSDEDLSNLMEEYDRLAAVKKNRDFKIRAVLFPIESLKKISPTPSIDSRSSPTSPILGSDYRYVHRVSPPPTARRRFSGEGCCHACCGGTGREKQRQRLYFVPSWNS
ncbi:PB1 domain [Dillenia turbinata]|uniref:PB1 domain n=1 Tax=Dillenia turbinata TaxID=194707 RepID=A0AAN8YZ99_9MAGN